MILLAVPAKKNSFLPTRRLLVTGKERAVRLKKGIQSLPHMGTYVQKFRDFATKMGQPITLARARWLFVRGKFPAEMKRMRREHSLIRLRAATTTKLTNKLVESGVPANLYTGTSKSDLSVTESILFAVAHHTLSMRSGRKALEQYARNFYSFDGALLGNFHVDITGMRYHTVFRFGSRATAKQYFSNRLILDDKRGVHVSVTGHVDANTLEEYLRYERGELK